jgi:SAM-dependent methyltransferase
VNDNQAIGVPSEFDHYADPTSILARVQGHTFLDLGAGYGRYSIALARTGIEVFAAEPAQGMIRRLRFNVNSEHLKNKIHIVRCDGRYLPFQSKSFDATICVSTIQYLPTHSWELVFREVKRTLNNGRFMLHFRRFDLAGMKRFLLIAANRALRSSKEVQENMISESKIKKMLRRSGFSNPEFIPPSTIVAASEVDSKLEPSDVE